MNWITILGNVFFDSALVCALVTGRMPYKPWFWERRRWIDRRENPYFYWFFTALLAFACGYGALTLAEQTIPGFHAPAFLD